MTESSLNPGISIKTINQKLLKLVGSLPLAIVLLLAIALFSIGGTVIEQKQGLTYYQENYPESPALFGFLTWKVLLTLGLDHVYTTWWYVALLVVFGLSLTACTFQRQLPALKAAQRWKFFTQPRQFSSLALSTDLPGVSLEAIAPLLQQKNYRLFHGDQGLYGRKGLVGRIGPIVVHGGMLVVLVGAIWGAFTGFMAQEFVASGSNFTVKNVFEAGIWSDRQRQKDWSVNVNRFWIDYTEQGDIDQFYSDLSVIDPQGQELTRKTIFVNEPLIYDGITFYQTTWGIAGVQVQLNNSPVFQLPMAQLPTEEGSGKIWGSWIPIKPDLSEGVSILTRDLQGSVLVYDAQGELIGAVREGNQIAVNGLTLKLVKLIGSTGLQIKADPGVPIVYGGFALLMAGVVMSYFSHSQVWALQVGDRLYVGGKTNRAQVTFERELTTILDQLAPATPITEQD